MDREEELCDLRESERLTVFIESRTPALPAPLSELEEKALAENVPIIRPMTQNLLLFFMELNAPRSVLEIGTGVGFSALLMESALPEGGRITTIEKDPARAAEAAEHFRSFGAGPDRIRLIQGDAQEAIEALAAEGRVCLVRRAYDMTDISGADIVLANTKNMRSRKMRSVMDDMMNEASTFVLRFKAIVIDYLTIDYLTIYAPGSLSRSRNSSVRLSRVRTTRSMRDTRKL